MDEHGVIEWMSTEYLNEHGVLEWVHGVPWINSTKRVGLHNGDQRVYYIMDA